MRWVALLNIEKIKTASLDVQYGASHSITVEPGAYLRGLGP